MQHSIATVSLSGGLEQKLDAIASAGFDGVELLENDLISCPLSPSDVRDYLRELDLALLLYQPFRDFEAAPAELFAHNLRRAERKLELMDELGAELMLVCSSVSDHAPDDDRLVVDQLCTLADRAAVHGIRIAYEALAWGRNINRFADSWRIVQAAEHPNLGVCLDSFHVLARGDDPAPISEIPGEKIFFVQLADAPLLAMDVLQWSRHHRCLPGQGAFDLASFVERVLLAGYTGPLSLEVFNDVLRQASAERTAVDAMRSLVVLEDSVARRRLELLNRVELSTLPARPALNRYAFVELAVDRVSEPVIEQLLAALGLERSGQHRSKPVELWSGGEVRVVLNCDERSVFERGQGVTRISTIALECRDAERSAERAALLLAPRLPRRRGPREASLDAFLAPDGTSVFVCPLESAPGRVWVDDFISVNGAHAGDAPLLEIDHVAFSQPFECFDETLLFYRAVLGLEPQASHELAAPNGLIRSRALTDDGGGVRVVLNVPAFGGTAGGAVDVNHVAFRCGDIFEAAAAVRAQGVPVLAITDNYYDDLIARLELDGELVEAMRELGILYDRDAGGEFFHFYMPPAGAHLFFEVVERRGGYEGYGAANSIVRMTAQRGWLETSGVA